MAMKRRAGIIQLTAGDQKLQAKGNFSYNLGLPKRVPIVGADGIHGWKDVPQEAFIEGEITDSDKLQLARLVTGEDLTVVLQLAVGPAGPAKAIALSEAAYGGDGTGNSEEGNIGVRWFSDVCKEVLP